MPPEEEKTYRKTDDLLKDPLVTLAKKLIEPDLLLALIFLNLLHMIFLV